MCSDKFIDDGGPAFPRTRTMATGMSLRDWFAGMAMNAISCECFKDGYKKGVGATTIRDQVVVGAYGMADAMLAERRDKETVEP